MPLYLILGLGLGFVIPLHVSMNSRAGALGGSPAIANVAFWIVGLATSLAIAAGELSRGGLSRFGPVPAPLWLAGGIGAGISLAISVLIPKLGVANASFLMILGRWSPRPSCRTEASWAPEIRSAPRKSPASR